MNTNQSKDYYCPKEHIEFLKSTEKAVQVKMNYGGGGTPWNSIIPKSTVTMWIPKSCIRSNGGGYTVFRPIVDKFLNSTNNPNAWHDLKYQLRNGGCFGHRNPPKTFIKYV